MGEQTATDRLRAQLDERGVEWFAITETATEYAQEGTVYRTYEFCGGLQVVIVTPVAPEQAIVATVGVGPCHSTSKWTNVFKCSVCGFEYDFITDPYQGPHYCPNCGRRCVG